MGKEGNHRQESLLG
jgi:hypothetical protein